MKTILKPPPSFFVLTDQKPQLLPRFFKEKYPGERPKKWCHVFFAEDGFTETTHISYISFCWLVGNVSAFFLNKLRNHPWIKNAEMLVYALYEFRKISSFLT